MELIKHKNGITLISLVISIIVVLILAGIVVSISYQTLLNKTETAINTTVEAMLEERVEMALADYDFSYWYNIYYVKKLVEEDSFVEEFKVELQSMIEAEDIVFDGNILTFTYKSDQYKFYISEDKSVNAIYDLKGNVQIGDYLEYEVEYIDVYSHEKYTAPNGWVVIDDGLVEGTSGTVKILSKGVPGKWYSTMMAEETGANFADELNNNFSQIRLLGDSGDRFYGSTFFNNFANKVKILSLEELNFAYNIINNENRNIYDTSRLTKMDDLFYLEDVNAYYWISTNTLNNNSLYYTNCGEILNNSDLRMGIRVVVELKDDLSAIFKSGVWKIIN